MKKLRMTIGLSYFHVPQRSFRHEDVFEEDCQPTVYLLVLHVVLLGPGEKQSTL